MKNTKKKGFTLVELLFVMAIISILAGFAIANLKDSTKVATENSMKNDIKNAIAQQQTYFSANQAYDEVSGYFEDSTNGVLEGDSGTKFTISKGNGIYSSSETCADGSLGFYVRISNSNNSIDKEISYDSCTDGVIGNIEPQQG
jgi:prepilin-type N-terminal cleavage/methylation domain-containing protein